MTAELAVEQAAGTLAAERLSAETAERLRIERDLQTVKLSNTTLQQVIIIKKTIKFTVIVVGLW